MKRITVVQHHPAEGPGRIATWASARGIALDTHFMDDDRPFPDEIGDALILLGGPASVVTPSESIHRERDALTALLQARPDLPVLGICLGAQLLASALGATLRRMPHEELGWTAVRIVDGSMLDVLQWHEDAFELPTGAKRLASSALCDVQGYRIGRRVGLQFHPEWDATTLAEMRRAHDGLPFAADDDDPRRDIVARWFRALLDELFVGA